MKLGEIWDSLMRQKRLVVLLLLVAILGVMAGSNLRPNSGGETTKNGMVEIEIPKTGENYYTSQIESEYSSAGGGVNSDFTQETKPNENDLENLLGPGAVWGGEAPDKAEAFKNVPKDPVFDAPNNTPIIACGIIGIILVIISARFLFDHYVR